MAPAAFWGSAVGPRAQQHPSVGPAVLGEMGKGYKVVVCGMASVGKTAILEQLLYGKHTVGEIFLPFFFFFLGLFPFPESCSARAPQSGKPGPRAVRR